MRKISVSAWLVTLIFFSVLLSNCGSSVFQTDTSVTLAVVPLSAELRVGEDLVLKAQETVVEVKGTSTKTTVRPKAANFNWEVEEGTGAGLLTPDFSNPEQYLYTAPMVAGVYHIKVTSKEFPDQVTRSTVLVNE